jgi:hypothetical protein
MKSFIICAVDKIFYGDQIKTMGWSGNSKGRQWLGGGGLD